LKDFSILFSYSPLWADDDDFGRKGRIYVAKKRCRDVWVLLFESLMKEKILLKWSIWEMRFVGEM